MTANGHITLVTGGARSGKSALAERLVMRYRLPVTYIATAQAADQEMSDRIQQHRRIRDGSWLTVEEPVALDHALRASDGQGACLIDCLTLWLANCGNDDRINDLVMTLGQLRSPVVLVTNELGQGIVPGNALARRFRDSHGWMNQAVARVADEVWMAVSGQALRIKPARDEIDAGI